MSNVSISDSIPSLADNQELICVRVGSLDYHFMRYDKQTNAWYHKPGKTAVLKYKFVPSYDRIWINENSYKGTESVGKDIYNYNSAIKFIRYTKNTIQLPNESATTKSMTAGKDIIYEINVSATTDYTLNISSSKSMVAAKMYNSDMELLWTQKGTAITKGYRLSVAKYYLQLYLEGSIASGNVSIRVSPEHVYRFSYTWVDGTQHRSYCECGEYKLEKHYVSLGGSILYSIGTGTYKTCLYCHGRADMGFVLSQGIRNSFVTPNGSCILPNGVRVIAPKDMEALFNGTLMFNSANVSFAA
ncbi:MAG: hypothetical protein NC132_03450 [Corallococcus sp.]|nr:hypothetical protein [Corallococcus sp.]MCM1359558.1 hypothetical protein [Corallococcus sp.]MCM1395150.1 hypothetical protein [Corallococcus sp.]